MKLQTPRDLVNSGILGTFLYFHYCPFLNTCGLYPHDGLNTWSATTVNDKLVHEENTTAPPIVEVMHWSLHLHCCGVPEGAPQLLGLVGQVGNTPQVG